MEAIRKQASKLREQVAKQQQAVLKQLGHFAGEAFVVDEAEQVCYQQLQNLYNSTRAAKHLQRSIVRGIEALISIGSKQMEIVRKLADDSCKYGESQNRDSALARAALQFGTSHESIEDEREMLLEILANQVSEPLRVLINGAPLEDARHLTRRYDKLRQEVEAQATEVLRRQTKSRNSTLSADGTVKLKTAEGRLYELKSSMMSLGREATDAMLSVEDQQQQITFQRLHKMVDAERCYHQNVISILEKLHAEMILEEQLNGPSSPSSATVQSDDGDPDVPGDAKATKYGLHDHIDAHSSYFIAKAIHSFDAQADGELSLSVGDYVIIRQVAPTGWSEGECNGKAGWFPSAYIEQQQKAPPSRVSGTTSDHSDASEY